MRVQGGTAGILAALEYGRLDPLYAGLDEDRPVTRFTNKDWEAIARHNRRSGRLAFALIGNRSPF